MKRGQKHNPQPVGVMTGACDALPHRVATRGTSPAVKAAGVFRGERA